MKLKIGFLRCTICYGRALAVVDSEGEQTLITPSCCHNGRRLVQTFSADIPDEFLVGVECPVHAFSKHGQEAEELRKGVQEIIDSSPEPWESIHDALTKLLDEVDARDSLAFLERK